MPEKELPIQPEVRKQANKTAQVIDQAINPDGGKHQEFNPAVKQ